MNYYEPFSELNPHDATNRRIYGVSVGIVTNVNDPEKQGRVKLKLPLRECENETDWVRIASLMAASDLGAFFLPEVNDEVLVAFNEGNVREPFVIGVLWNPKAKPPVYTVGEKVNIRKLKTRSGHEIVFTEESGKEKIEILTPGGHSLTMDDEAKKIELKNGTGNNNLVIEGQGNKISINSDQKILCKAQSSSVEIDSSGGITIKSTGSIKIESSASLKIKGQQIDIEGQMLNLKGNGMVKINGSMVKIN
jgi:uncharacterized protein involved in type VI secretion and phage assembly